MKTLYKKASHLRSHTWKDIGGLGGLLLDGAFFVFLLVISLAVIVLGAAAVVIDYVLSPVLGLMSLGRNTRREDQDDAVLLEDGTLGHRPYSPAKTAEPETPVDLNWPYYL